MFLFVAYLAVSFEQRNSAAGSAEKAAVRKASALSGYNFTISDNSQLGNTPLEIEEHLNTKAEKGKKYYIKFVVSGNAVDFNVYNGTNICYHFSGKNFNLIIREEPQDIHLDHAINFTLTASPSSLVLPLATFTQSEGLAEATFKELHLDLTESNPLRGSKVTEILDIYNNSEITWDTITLPAITSDVTVLLQAKHLAVLMDVIQWQGRYILFKDTHGSFIAPKSVRPYGSGANTQIQLSSTSHGLLNETLNKTPIIIEFCDVAINGFIAISSFDTSNNATIRILSPDGRMYLLSTTLASISLGPSVQAVVTPETLKNIHDYQSQTSGTYYIGTDKNTLKEITYVTGGIKIGDDVFSNVRILNRNGAANPLTLKYESGNIDVALECLNNSKVIFDASFANAGKNKVNVIAESDYNVMFEAGDGVDLYTLLDIKNAKGESIPLKTFLKSDTKNNHEFELILIAVLFVIIVSTIVTLCCCFRSQLIKKKDKSSSSSTSSLEKPKQIVRQNNKKYRSSQQIPRSKARRAPSVATSAAAAPSPRQKQMRRAKSVYNVPTDSSDSSDSSDRRRSKRKTKQNRRHP